MKKINVTAVFVDPVLGTCPNDRNIFTQFIAGKNPTASVEGIEDEINALPDPLVDEDGVPVDEKGITVFPRTLEGIPFIFDYQWKGFFKEKCKFLKKDAKSRSAKLANHLKVIDGSVFVQNRQNPIILPEGGEITLCQRPLRAQTAQGERVALSCSEEIPAGSICNFTVICEYDELVLLVKEWLDYGILHGTGQWRNSGKGRFLIKYNSVEDCTLAEYTQAKREQLISDNAAAAVAAVLEKLGADTACFEGLAEASDLTDAVAAEKKAAAKAKREAKKAATKKV